MTDAILDFARAVFWVLVLPPLYFHAMDVVIDFYRTIFKWTSDDQTV